VPAVKTHTADLATRLVDEAGRVLSAEGVAALSLRRIATATDTSTMAVYTLFGDKQGLLAAMYRAGFERLGASMAAASVDADPAGPLTTLAELGLAYRRAALANPHLYNLMFGRPADMFQPDPADKEMAESTYRPLVDAVQRCLEAGELVGADAEQIAFFLWAVSHGVVSLEIAGQLTGDAAERDKTYRDAMIYSVVPFLPPH